MLLPLLLWLHSWWLLLLFMMHCFCVDSLFRGFMFLLLLLLLFIFLYMIAIVIDDIFPVIVLNIYEDDFVQYHLIQFSDSLLRVCTDCLWPLLEWGNVIAIIVIIMLSILLILSIFTININPLNKHTTMLRQHSQQLINRRPNLTIYLLWQLTKHSYKFHHLYKYIQH